MSNDSFYEDNYKQLLKLIRDMFHFNDTINPQEGLLYVYEELIQLRTLNSIKKQEEEERDKMLKIIDSLYSEILSLRDKNGKL
jgi:hypothetical protein